MGRIQRPSSFSNLIKFPEFARFVSGWADAISLQINGNLQFVDNFKAAGPYVVDFLNSTDTYSVTHGLGQVPQGYIVVNQDAAASIYAPLGATWTSSTIYLKASSAVAATIYVI